MPGRLTAWKGQEVFIEALNLVNKEFRYINLFMLLFWEMIKVEMFIQKR